jgi:hypothetical protein
MRIEPKAAEDIFVTPEEGRRQFDEAVRARMGISGDEFIRRYEAGEYDDVADRDGSLHIGRLIGLIAFAARLPSVACVVQ